MQLDSARELKAALQSSVVAQLAEPPRLRSLGVPAGPVPVSAVSPRTLALGIAPTGGADFRLAVRLQRRALEGSETVEAIRRQARGEVEVRYIGRVVKRGNGGPFQARLRPLQIGGSVGHFKITAGTLGAFVRARAGGGPLILSNNHVLANENRAKKGDAILQPGQFDHGADPGDRIGTLADFKRLKRAGANLIDYASAVLAPGLDFDSSGLAAVGTLRGIRSGLLRTQEIVHKVGRTTGITNGRVTAIEMDNVVIDYDIGSLRFDQQIEIEGADDEGFSAGGDSGSLIVDEDGQALALLFAGGDTGGTNGKGLTYANPLQTVLDALKVDLLL
jgi:hypothetical protein